MELFWWGILLVLVLFALLFVGVAVSHFVFGLTHRAKTLATIRDYTPQAQLLGNGGHYLGKFDFYVTICPRCQNNDEYDGCPNCHSHQAKLKIVVAGSSILIRCPICKQEKVLDLRCTQCGAIEVIQFINFYKGSFTPQVQANIKEARGQALPDQEAVARIEMPTKLPPPKRRSPRI